MRRGATCGRKQNDKRKSRDWAAIADRCAAALLLLGANSAQQLTALPLSDDDSLSNVRMHVCGVRVCVRTYVDVEYVRSSNTDPLHTDAPVAPGHNQVLFRLRDPLRGETPALQLVTG